jgi:ABC-2 type transport system permease protein
MPKTSLRAYRAIFLTSVRQSVAYWGSFALQMIGMTAMLVSSLAVWRVLLADGDIGGYDWPTMQAYLTIAFITGTLGTANGDFPMAERIRDGQVAIDLTKPVDFQWARLAENLGGLVTEVGAIVVAVAVMIALPGDLPAPDPAHALLAVVAIACVIPLKFMIVYGSTLLVFWTQNYWGLSWCRWAVVAIFSGALVPLNLLPSWLRGAAEVLPFAGVTATPAAIYLEQVSLGQAAVLIGQQVAWILALYVLARLTWRVAVRQVTVHGG